MRKSWLIARREWSERVSSRSFLGMAILGPLVLLFFLFMLFQLGGKTSVKWKVLVSDKGQILSNKMASRLDSNVTYYFVNEYVEIDEFAKAKKFQEFDALLEVNEKVLSNKVGFVFYREMPSKNLEKKVQYQLERRLEEVLIDKFQTISQDAYRQIKQPLMLSFRNTYDPKDQGADKRAWVGLTFGVLIFVFIGLFGMTILRSTTREKSSRIVEVLLGAIRPIHLMVGKIWGIGMAAFLQFAIWASILVAGLSWMRQSYFPDYLEANISQAQTNAGDAAIYQYNEFVELVFERIQFGPMLAAFVIFFTLGFLFYAALFSAFGASLGSESDGQQFVIPLLLLLGFGVYSAYYVLQNPSSPYADLLLYIPFTAPSVAMVKLAWGFEPGQAHQIYLSAIVLALSSLFFLYLSARIYKHGILQVGHRMRWSMLFNWLRKK